MKYKKVIVNTCLIISLYLLYSLSHEVAHLAIYENYGCEDVNIRIWKTTAYCGNIDNKSYYEQQHLNSLNEIINYNLSVPIFVALYFYIKKNINI